MAIEGKYKFMETPMGIGKSPKKIKKNLAYKFDIRSLLIYGIIKITVKIMEFSVPLDLSRAGKFCLSISSSEY